MIYPSEPVLTAPTSTCNSAFTLPVVTAVTGFTVQYSIDGGAWATAPVIPTTPGCHTIAARYVNTAACGSTAALTPSTIVGCDASAEVSVLIYPSEPVLTAPTNTCNSAFTLPVVTAVTGFTVQYSIDGSAWATAPVIPTTPGCHTIAARYVNTVACGSTAALTPSTIAGCDASAEVSVLIYPSEPVLTAPTNTCNSAFSLPVVTAVTGFTVQYSIDGGAWATAPVIPTTPGCHTIAARYVNTASCGSTAALTPSTIAGCDASSDVSVVIFPAAPVITMPQASCMSDFRLPVVTSVTGFSIQYSVNGGAWTANPMTSMVPGCYAIQARYVLETACGSTAAGSIGTGLCSVSNTVNTNVYPVPVIDPVADVFMCDMAQVDVAFTSQTEIDDCFGGGSVQYEWTNNNTSIGLASSGTGNISFMATQPGTAFIIVTPVFVGPDGRCKGQPKTFIITIHQETSITCNSKVNISLDENCEFDMNASFVLTENHNALFYEMVIKTSSGQIVDNSNVSLHLGEMLSAEVTDICNGNKCWGYVVFEDKIAPTVECNCSGPAPDVSAFREIGKFGNKKYYLSNSTYTWQQAYAHSQAVGGEMLCITSAAENAFIVNTWTLPGFTAQRTWLGATDNEAYGGTEANNTNNGWVWVSGEPFVYTNWASGEPNGLANEDYVEMFGNAGTQPGKWNDNTNTFGPLRYIMEVEDCSFKCYDLSIVQGETVEMLYGQSQNKAVLTTPPTATDGCGEVTATFEDSVQGEHCGDKELLRSWTFTDSYGNKSYCTQTFTFGAITVNDLTPPQYLVELSCGVNTDPANIAALKDVDSRPQPSSSTNIGAYYDDWAQTPTVTELHEGYAHGYFTYQQIGYDGNYHAQKVDPNICEIFTTYTDTNYPACGAGCGGNMKVVREWRILDWCSQDVFGYLQVIKAVDDKAPTFAVKDATVSVDPWGCVATYRVDNPWELQDNCAKPEELTWTLEVPAGVSLSGVQGSYVLTGLTKGTHTITYIATDCCGNVGTAEATITVIDASAPVAVAKQYIVMSLTGSGTAADGAAKLYGHQLDNGSYDHCTDVAFEVRRVDGGSCGNVGVNNHNNNSTFNGNNFASEVPGAVWFHPMDSRYTNADGNFDTDGGEFVKFCCDDIPEGEEYGLHDVELRVWDDGNMNGVYGDNLIIDGMKDNYNTTWVTVRVENKLAPVLVCPADVTVTCDMELNLSVGKDTKVTDVDLTMTGYPSAYDLCKGLDITYRDAWIGTYDEICKSGTIRRTFKATKGSVSVTCVQYITVTTVTFPFVVTFPQDGQTTPWDKCGFSSDDLNDQNNSLIKRPVVNNGPCDIIMENVEIDTFLNENGACKKWRVTYNYLNWCTQETSGPWVHYYTFKDVEAPILTCNNQMFAANPLAANPDGACYASVVLEASATDTLICAEESWIKWQVFADLWANGTVDRLGSSFINKAYNGIWVYIPRILNGSVNPAWTTMQNLHPNLVLADDLYVTYVKPTAASGGKATLPAFNLLAENINHKVLWKVTDGCGNVDQCESTVMSVDKKAPTPYCVSVHTAIMQTNPKMVELWAVDFNKGSFDNCTPQSKLYYTFEGTHPVLSRLNQEHYFKGLGQNATVNEYNQGKAYRWLPASRSAGYVWLTAGTHAVNVSVWDEAWNTDFCTVNLQVNDTANTSNIAGRVISMMQVPMKDAEISILSNTGTAQKALTVEDGSFQISASNGGNYEITSHKNVDFMDGVSTFDLVLIQRHILNIETLNDAYKMIAADADNNGTVSVNDLSEIRKLILGIHTQYPNNESWRFVKTGQSMDPEHPFPYIENIVVQNLNANISNVDFIGVKIGDVNGNAKVND
ncbi:MAG: lectin-like protein, partial [Saprospiraceae bacterium]